MNKEKALARLQKAKNKALANSTGIKVGILEFNEAIKALEIVIALQDTFQDTSSTLMEREQDVNLFHYCYAYDENKSFYGWFDNKEIEKLGDEGYIVELRHFY